jgi:thiol:disulfide interchange protein
VEAVTIGVVFLLLAIYLVTRTGNLGGMAYGERWFVQVVPLLMAFLPFAPPFTRMRQDVWRWLTAPLLTVMLVVSLISSFQGAQNPWRYVPPPAHPTRDPSTGVIGWRWEYR